MKNILLITGILLLKKIRKIRRHSGSSCSDSEERYPESPTVASHISNFADVAHSTRMGDSGHFTTPGAGALRFVKFWNDGPDGKPHRSADTVRIVALITGLLLMCLPTLAQTLSFPTNSLADTVPTLLDSISLPASMLPDTLQQRYGVQQHRLDSTAQHYAARIDSIEQEATTLMNKQAKRLKPAFVDSLAQTIPRPISDALPKNLSALPSVPHHKIPPLPTLKALPQKFPAVDAVQKNIQRWQQPITQYQQQASSWSQKLQNIPQSAEQQLAASRPELKVLQENAQPAWMQSASDDPKQATAQQKAQMQQKILAQAQDHFAGHTQTLTTARDEMMQWKKKYRRVQTDQDIFEKKSSLQGKSLGERLTFGGGFQVVPGPPLGIQTAPQIGYQINKKWLIGMSGNYRMQLTADYRGIVTNGAIYGGSTFTHYQFWKGFLVHGEAEVMSQSVRQQDAIQRTWQTNMLVGVGKTYNLVGQWQGKVVLLYNITHQQQSLYPRPWMIRLAFYRGK